MEEVKGKEDSLVFEDQIVDQPVIDAVESKLLRALMNKTQANMKFQHDKSGHDKGGGHDKESHDRSTNDPRDPHDRDTFERSRD